MAVKDCTATPDGFMFIKPSCLNNKMLFVLDIDPIALEGGVAYCGLGIRPSD